MESTIFKEASGSVRGTIIQKMDFPKGKKVESKRICHAYILENEPLDHITVDLPKKMSIEQLREAARKLAMFADELEYSYSLPRGAMTYRQVIEQYENILGQNPGKGLIIGSDSIAFIHDGVLLTGRFADGVVNQLEMGEPDPRSWCHDEAHWPSDDSWQQTTGYIHDPKLVEYEIK